MKKLQFIFLAMTLSTCISAAQAMLSEPPYNPIRTERCRTNTIDALLTTFIAQAVHDYLLQNPEHLSLIASVCWGVGSWLTGELAETIYKKIYKKITGRYLRDALGKTEIFGVQFDNQRLLRRIITVTSMCISLYLST